MNPIWFLFVILQIAPILKNISKSAGKVQKAGIVSKAAIGSSKAALKISSASHLMLMDDFMKNAEKIKIVTSEESALKTYAETISKENKIQGKIYNKPKSLNGKKSSIYDNYTREEYERILKDKIEDYIEQLLADQLQRDFNVWKLSMIELMNSNYWNKVRIYFKNVYHFNLERKVDFLLLMNEMPVNAFRMSEKEIHRFLAKNSPLLQAVSIDILHAELSKHKPIVDKLTYYAENNRLQVKFLKRKSTL